MNSAAPGVNHEVWQCQSGPITVAVDSAGCPLDGKYCKIQAGATTLALAAAATATITVTVTNLVAARIRGFFMQASQPTLVAPAGEGDLLDYVGVTSIDVLGNEHISGEVPASRYRSDTTGSDNNGLAQFFRGDLGTAGGVLAVIVINRSAVAINVWAGADVSGTKAA